MSQLLKKEWPLLLVLTAPFVFLARVWPQIPEHIPIHFNAAFHPDGWMRKPGGVLLTPLCTVLIMLVIRGWFHFDPKMKKSAPETRAQVARVLDQVLLATAALFSAVSVAIVWAAWGQLGPIAKVFLYGLPLHLIVIGNGMGKLRPNYTIGIRLPWTLASTTVWNRTHRLAGRLMVAMGAGLLAMVVAGLGQELFFLAFLPALGLWAAIVTGYAFLQSRAETNPASPGGSPAQ